MLRILPALAVLALGFPASASAAPFGELPFQPVSSYATCLQATGTPGELLRQTETTTSFLSAGPAGLTAGGALPTDGARDCVDVAGWPGGGGVLAFPVESPADDEVWVRGFLREPGQRWGEPIDILPPEDRFNSISIAVAASERGDALVAANSRDLNGRGSVLVARRLPGGAFGAPERLAGTRTYPQRFTEVHAGYSASGEAVVTWIQPGATGHDPPDVWAAIAPPGAPFGPPQRVGYNYDAAPHALAVGADGRALVVFSQVRRLVAAERAPGGTFGTPATIARVDDGLDHSVAAVLRPGGGAVVVWTSPGTAGMTARTREQAGPFGRAIELVYPKQLDRAAKQVQQRFVGPGRGDLARAILTADGRAMVTWGHLARRQGLWQVVPGVARVAFSGDDYEVYGLTGGLRELAEITPVVLSDGTPGVAWSDNGADSRGGRIHVAREGAPDPAEPAAPKVTFGPPRSRTLNESEPLILRVTCSAACDVYAQLAGAGSITASVSLAAAGSRRLVFSPDDRPIAPRGGGKVRVLVHSSAPGARTVTTRTLTLDLRRAKTVFPPRVLGLTVARDGDELVVRWRTAKPARPFSYVVMAFDKKDNAVAMGDAEGSAARTRFVVRIHKPRKAVSVTVFAVAENADKYRRTTVEVPR